MQDAFGVKITEGGGINGEGFVTPGLALGCGYIGVYSGLWMNTTKNAIEIVISGCLHGTKGGE